MYVIYCSLPKLSKLINLTLWQCDLPGGLPDVVTKLTRLQYLTIFGCELRDLPER